MNNKGFTLVELLVSFVLSMVLVIIMFELIIKLKELYVTSAIKTEMINKQNLMVNKIYTDINEKKLKAINSCGTNCINFIYSDNSTKMLYIDTAQGIINYDNYTIKLNNGSVLSSVTIRTISSIGPKVDKIFIIDIPIENPLFKNENFGLNIVYPYNSAEMTSDF